MLVEEPTAEMVEQWKRIFAERRGSLCANRKTGCELIRYFESKYPFSPIKNAKFEQKFKKAAERNIRDNEHSRSRIPAGVQPEIPCCCVGRACVAIDAVSGEFHVECEDTACAARLYDDLFAYRGLDDADLSNFFLVAQYVTLTAR